LVFFPKPYLSFGYRLLGVGDEARFV
jgi:hypothetical protein